MFKTVVATLAVLTGLSLAMAMGMNGGPEQGSQTASAGSGQNLRIGVYDNRAIGIAYAASKFNPVSEKMKEYEAAKAAGDEQRVKELTAWGEKHQRALHRQGFGRVPVTDLLEPVKTKLPAVAKDAGVDAIVFECSYVADGLEKVDVTMELVKLYDPSEQTLKWVRESLKRQPVDLDEIDQVKD